MSHDFQENTVEKGARDALGRFLPGSRRNIRNPNAGRPPVIKHIRELARAQTETAFETLLFIATSGESESARVAAIKEIFDRGWGKAAQPHTGDGGKGPVKMVVSWLDPEPDPDGR